MKNKKSVLIVFLLFFGIIGLSIINIKKIRDIKNLNYIINNKNNIEIYKEDKKFSYSDIIECSEKDNRINILHFKRENNNTIKLDLEFNGDIREIHDLISFFKNKNGYKNIHNINLLNKDNKTYSNLKINFTDR
ncbi:hypothetical protein [Clostridium rectalis]|uniref:hypothetical protein n=1 Tax=Clostridium rectalis TaxID=2040295 RepID=UPI000F636484|nr:hypothetical protein [Clostridium rectalis]